MTILLASAMEPEANLSALLAFFACLCGMYLLGQGLLAWRRRKLQTARVTAIRSVRPGLAEVHGKAEGPHTMAAAVSGKDCYFYKTTIWREDSRKSGEWKKAVEETFSLPFFLTDSTGRILLDPRGAEVEVLRDVYEEYGKTMLSTHTDIPERLEVFLARHAIATGAAIRVEEYSIAPATEIFAIGTIVKNTDGLDLSATPLNRVEGGYGPKVHSAIAEEGLPQGESEVAAKPQSIPKAPPAPEPAEPQAATSNISINVTSPQGAPTHYSAAQPEVIRLSLPSPADTPEQMTMQSRLAAALRRANASSPDTWGMPLPEAHPASVAIQEGTIESAVGSASNDRASAQNHVAAREHPGSSAVSDKAAPSSEAPIMQFSERPSKTSPRPSKRAPALILRQGGGGSGLTLSARSQTENTKPSRIAATLVIAGPVLTLAGAYYLLISFGWL